MRKADRVIFEVSLGQLSFVSPRLWGVDCGFGGFCKGSWEKSFLLLTLMMLTSKINTFMIEFVQFIHCG
ncbi:hypothetical protein C4N23_00310 [Faecalibacterium hattorii]|uniref:Uncharacterized protein n=1 Tax=Faecalibacterium hattorii TaxID=2935520 RepID=A0A329UQ30_9FIRM|nr:hypothetical protein C4N23_00310 [Faecalibacterium hattorii]